MMRYRTALVLGLGKSGLASARLLLAEKSEVTVVDSADNGELRKRAKELRKRGAVVRLGVRGLGRVIRGRGRKGKRFDICITSPGICADSEWIRLVEAGGTAVISELELGASRCKCPLLAVTGSNGKSTMVKLCREALETARLRADMAGNYGVALCDVARHSGKLDWLVVEASSFQLEKITDFRPKVAVLMNIQANHIDRHGDMATYRRLKARIFENMGGDCTGVAPDELAGSVRRMAPQLRAWRTFGASRNAGARYVNGVVELRSRGRKSVVNVAGTMFDNPVMGLTAAAAAAAAEACGVGPTAVEKAIRRFKPLPHRMQEVAVADGVRFINNSKATTLAALEASLLMVDGRVRLLAGGMLKERDLRPTAGALSAKAERIYLFGKAARTMAAAWRNKVRCSLFKNMEAALRSAWRDAVSGETILLAPACTSFDQYRNFEERGEHFINLAHQLTKEKKK